MTELPLKTTCGSLTKAGDVTSRIRRIAFSIPWWLDATNTAQWWWWWCNGRGWYIGHLTTTNDKRYEIAKVKPGEGDPESWENLSDLSPS